ncbi:MAG: O-linked N-acetylglucosamine transferase family protein [Rhodospirillaceae bacterium]
MFRRAGEAGAEKLGFLFRSYLLLPRIAESVEQIRDVRARLVQGLDELDRMDGVIHDPPALTNDAFFYLAYAGENDRPVMEAARRMFRAHSPVLNYVSPHIEQTRARRREKGRPIRIAFLSQFLCSHTIGRLNKGLIAGLDGTKFHVTVIHTAAAKRDAMREAIDRAADATVTLPADLAAAQRVVADLQLDLLHFPDIGMNAFTYFLAYARLAPVQTVGWGHPDTTGLDTIDYFLSFDTGEAEGAAAHYTETLVRFSRPSVYYEPDAKIDPKPARADFGLPGTGALYGCLQSLFKFHPDFDAVMAEVLERDPAGRIVLVDWVQPTWRELLRARWARTYPILMERVTFQPRLPGDRFRQLVSLMDVMLDPLHFGGGNTFYEALAQGVPTVTWPSPFLRGRLITGFYRLLGVEEGLIAQDVKDFAEMAVTLATNPTRRTEICAPLMERAATLYRDAAAVRELEAFFEAAVNADLNGKTITDWSFTPSA